MVICTNLRYLCSEIGSYFSEEKFIVRYSAHALGKTCIQLQLQLEPKFRKFEYTS